MLGRISFIILAWFVPNLVFAANVRCNQEQTLCQIESTRLGLGDEIGFFTSDNELVARGKVEALKGNLRNIKIEKRFGPIKANMEWKPLSDAPTEKAVQEGEFKTYRAPAVWSAGGGYGYSRLGIGDGSTGHEFSGFANWRTWKYFALTGRAALLMASGTVDRNLGAGAESKAFSMFGFGLMPAVSATVLENKLISPRAELGVGLMYISADVGGDAKQVSGKGFNTNVTNGINMFLRGSVEALINLEEWHIQIGVGQSLIAEATGTILYLGAIKDLEIK